MVNKLREEEDSTGGKSEVLRRKCELGSEYGSVVAGRKRLRWEMRRTGRRK